MSCGKGPSIIDLLTGTLALAVILDVASAVLDGIEPEAGEEKSELELLEEAVTKSPSGRYVGIDLCRCDSAATVAEFLNKHCEFEFVSVHDRQLLLKRKNCGC